MCYRYKPYFLVFQVHPVMIACGAQEFDAATGVDKAKKLLADLAHKEAERARIGREHESLKVRQ